MKSSFFNMKSVDVKTSRLHATMLFLDNYESVTILHHYVRHVHAVGASVYSVRGAAAGST